MDGKIGYQPVYGQGMPATRFDVSTYENVSPRFKKENLDAMAGLLRLIEDLEHAIEEIPLPDVSAERDTLGFTLHNEVGKCRDESGG